MGGFWRTRSGAVGRSAAAPAAVEWQLLSLPFVRARLRALAAELERLDRDPDVFAKAFHTMVATSAYEALAADAARLAAQERRPEIERAGPSYGVREVLEL